VTTVLDVLREEFGEWANEQPGTVTSFERGARFQGDESQHQFGLAADWGYRSNSLPVVARIADAGRARGYVVVWEDDHLHVQRFEKGFLARCGLFA